MSLTTLKSLFAYKAWANAELYALLGTLAADRHADTLHGCVRTLNHVYVVDRIFRAHLAGEPRPFDATNTRQTPTLGQLRDDVETTDAWYVAYVDGLAEPALAESISFTFTDGDAGRMSREEILLHVITHGGYHRGNVGERLQAASLAPPRDLYTKYLHASEPTRRQP
jgi:uncharacterized damage-inducible protein DinB